MTKYWLGKKRSEETKRKISLAKMGVPHPITRETALKISRALTGKKKSPKHIENIRKTHTNKREDHPRWKGGKYPDYRGYILVYHPNHPFPKFTHYVYEHRLVMEKHLGRYLNSLEVIHHINKNPSDNRIENLLLTTNSEHRKYHVKNKLPYHSKQI